MKQILLFIVFLCTLSTSAQVDVVTHQKKQQTTTVKNSKPNSNKTNKGNERKSGIIVNRNYSNISVSRTYLSFSSYGGSETITINCSGSWNVSVNPVSWGHLTRNGNSLTLRVDANNSTNARTDYICVKCGSKEVRINISQSGNYSDISVSRTNLSFPSYGGSETITVNCSGSWNVSVNPLSWGHLTRNGNTLTLRVDANNSSNSRTDYICVKCGSKEVRINLSQSGSSYSSNSSSNSRVTASITKIWADYNVSDAYGNKGMNIHVKFDINGMLNRTGKAVAYFYRSNGTALVDMNNSYRTTNGKVSVGKDFVPNYENCTFNDLVMFIPYSELHLYSNTSCYFTVSIWNGNSELAISDKYNFEISF